MIESRREVKVLGDFQPGRILLSTICVFEGLSIFIMLEMYYGMAFIDRRYLDVSLVLMS